MFCGHLLNPSYYTTVPAVQGARPATTAHFTAHLKCVAVSAFPYSRFTLRRGMEALRLLARFAGGLLAGYGLMYITVSRSKVGFLRDLPMIRALGCAGAASSALPREETTASLTDVFISNCTERHRKPLILLVGCLQLLLAKLVPCAAPVLAVPDPPDAAAHPPHPRPERAASKHVRLRSDARRAHRGCSERSAVRPPRPAARSAAASEPTGSTPVPAQPDPDRGLRRQAEDGGDPAGDDAESSSRAASRPPPPPPCRCRGRRGNGIPRVHRPPPGLEHIVR